MEVNMDPTLIGMCGAYCGVCEWKEPSHCPGCQANRGKMFWGQCSMAACCSGKGLRHCGLCPDLPCQILRDGFSNPEHGDNGERLANLKSWARGDDACLKLTKIKPAGA
jgi:hypothetical protein